VFFCGCEEFLQRHLAIALFVGAFQQGLQRFRKAGGDFVLGDDAIVVGVETHEQRLWVGGPWRSRPSSLLRRQELRQNDDRHGRQQTEKHPAHRCSPLTQGWETKTLLIQ
jgi:hypothetical protein